MLKTGDFVRRTTDGMKGRVVDAQPRLITLFLTNKDRVELHPIDAMATLEVWEGDPKTGQWVPASK